MNEPTSSSSGLVRSLRVRSMRRSWEFVRRILKSRIRC
jgi:hypothetical protein